MTKHAREVKAQKKFDKRVAHPDTCDICGNSILMGAEKKDKFGVYCPSCWKKFGKSSRKKK